MTVFSKKLLSVYSNHVIPEHNLFPDAVFVQMGLATGARMSQRRSESMGVAYIS